MTNINLTAALRSNLLSLQGNQAALDKTQLRLSTGKKINSALDNANSFYASRSLSFRASDLGKLTDNMAQSIQVLKAADHGIAALSKLVTQAKATAQSARDTVGGAASSSFTSGDKPVGAVMPPLSNLVITTTLYGASIIISGQTLPQIAANINSLGGNFVAQVVPGTGTPATQRLEISSSNGRPLTLGPDASATNYLITNHAASGGATAVDNNGTPYVAGTLIPAAPSVVDAVKLQVQYGDLLRQINQLVQDTGYRGTNLLNGDSMKVVFNESSSSTLNVTGVTFNARGLGLTSTSLQTSVAADRVLSELNGALATLRTQAKVFGTNMTIIQNRQIYTATLVNTLTEGSDQLILADKNEEGANLLSLQTSQQMGITALSLASQASQAVLRLFSS